MTFDASVFWTAFKAAGMLATATDADGDFRVGFTQPDRPRLDGAALSRDYEIEYQVADRPDLAKGDTLSIGGVSYRVREAPINAEGADGAFRIALLTKA